MHLSMLVSLSNKLGVFIWSTTLLLAGLAMIVSVQLASECTGFEKGFSVAEQNLVGFGENTLNIPVVGENIYFRLSGLYELMAKACALSFVGGLLLQQLSSIRRRTVVFVQLLCLASTLFASFQLWNIFHLKSIFVRAGIPDEPYYHLMTKTVPWDWLALLFVGTLFLSQGLCLLLFFLGKMYPFRESY